MSKEKLSDSFTKKQKKFIRDLIADDLAKYDLQEWQKACKSFGPFNYNETTRKMWFEENEFRVRTAREILEFTDRWAKSLRQEEILETTKMNAIRNELIEAIREEKERQGLKTNKLNSFKLATFKTLVSWADNPSKLEEGPYEGRKKLPADKIKRKVSRRGRKSMKGTYGPPLVNLVKNVEVADTKTLILEIAIINNYLHPYQNVNLELHLDSKLKVKAVNPFSWVPSDKLIKIGFVPSSLDVEPKETIIKVEVEMKPSTKAYSIDGIVHYDDTDRGLREKHDLNSQTFKV